MGFNIYGFKAKRFINNKIGYFINPILDILSWWFPFISRFLIAIKERKNSLIE